MDYFPHIVGQERVKRRLSFRLNNYKATHLFPHSIIVSPKGYGKTLTARSIGKHLTQLNSNSPRAFYEINCSTLKNVRQFFNTVIFPKVVEKEVTLFLDEAANIPDEVGEALLTILNPNPDHKTSFSLDEHNIEFDFRKVTFLLASTDAQQLSTALLDRLERIELESYTYDELGKIVKKGCPEIQIDEDLLLEISQTLRGNARAAIKMGGDISEYCASKRKKRIYHKDWEEIKFHLGIYPLGISPIELRLLKILSKRPQGTSLTQLASMTGLTRDAVQRDFETFLLKNELLEINKTGRNITRHGLKLLQVIND